jgi:hypothetical protein
MLIYNFPLLVVEVKIMGLVVDQDKILLQRLRQS